MAGEPQGMKLRSHVKQHRARLDLTQENLAQRVGVRRQTILAIEKGHYVPSTLLAFQIARVLEMRVDELFELREESDR
jgi:putative transcriptional regulator